MKKIIFASAATAMMLASAPAFANSDNDDFDINASVDEACTMENLNDVQLGTVDINTTAGSLALLIDGTSTGSTNNAWISCNESNSMTIASTNGGRLNNTTPSSGSDAGFKNTINYTLFADNYRNGLIQPGFRRTLFGLITVPSGTRGAIHRQVNFDVLIDPVNNLDARPTAGLYQDTVTVTVTTS